MILSFALRNLRTLPVVGSRFGIISRRMAPRQFALGEKAAAILRSVRARLEVLDLIRDDYGHLVPHVDRLRASRNSKLIGYCGTGVKKRAGRGTKSK